MIYPTKPKNFKSKHDVVSCFLEYNGEILLLHRPEHKNQGGKWGVPAGKTENGETLVQAIIRELREETSFVLAEEKKLLYFGKMFVKHPAYDFTYHIFHLPLSEKPNIILNPEEHQDFRWITPKDSLKIDLVTDQDTCVKLFYKLTLEKSYFPS